VPGPYTCRGEGVPSGSLALTPHAPRKGALDREFTESSKGDLSRRHVVAAGLAPLIVPRHVLGGTAYQAPAIRSPSSPWASAAWPQLPGRVQSREEGSQKLRCPDHRHAGSYARHPADAAIRMKKHIYCVKPIAHSIGEVRKVREALLAAKGLVTKGSIQDSRTDYSRSSTEILNTGVLGPSAKSTFGLSTRSTRPAWCGPRKRKRRRREWIGYVDRPGALPPVPQGVSSGQLACLMGFRHGGRGRHGLPHVAHVFRGTAAPRALRDLRLPLDPLRRHQQADPHTGDRRHRQHVLWEHPARGSMPL